MNPLRLGVGLLTASPAAIKEEAAVQGVLASRAARPAPAGDPRGHGAFQPQIQAVAQGLVLPPRVALVTDGP